MSFSTLGIGASSLYAAQRAAEVAAHNVANANTPGYTKQRLTTQTAIPTPGTAGVQGDGMRGNGVQVLAIDRLRDQLSDLSYRADAATSGSADGRADVLGRVEGVLGSYPDGAPEALNRFFAAFEQLNRTPQDPAARANVLSTGREVAAALGSAVGQIAQVSTDVGERMRTVRRGGQRAGRAPSPASTWPSATRSRASSRPTTSWTSATPRWTASRR